MTTVVVQKWEESERGWGVRPDGYSLHPDIAALKRYIAAYWKKMPDGVPDEYSRPSGTPYLADINDIDFKGQIGLRIFDNKYPGEGGKDGWVNS